jgi:hypothetical protein
MSSVKSNANESSHSGCAVHRAPARFVPLLASDAGNGESTLLPSAASPTVDQKRDRAGTDGDLLGVDSTDIVGLNDGVGMRFS